MHPNRREELDLFKSRINLTEYASAQGYVLDRKHSSRNSVAMRGPSGDKVIIARDARDGNWIYFSVTDEEDNGTIIDFVTRRHPLQTASEHCGSSSLLVIQAHGSKTTTSEERVAHRKFLVNQWSHAHAFRDELSHHLVFTKTDTDGEVIFQRLARLQSRLLSGGQA
jgi:hypothetical protein